MLLASNNKITSWAEVERLSSLTALTHLLLAGNPLATEYRDRGASLEYRLEMLWRLPRLTKIDGLAVGPQLLGHTAFNWAIKYLSATVVTVAILGEPIGSAILALLIFQQPLQALQLIGGAVLLIGIAVTTLAERKTK